MTLVGVHLALHLSDIYMDFYAKRVWTSHLWDWDFFVSVIDSQKFYSRWINGIQYLLKNNLTYYFSKSGIHCCTFKMRKYWSYIKWSLFQVTKLVKPSEKETLKIDFVQLKTSIQSLLATKRQPLKYLFFTFQKWSKALRTKKNSSRCAASSRRPQIVALNA